MKGHLEGSHLGCKRGHLIRGVSLLLVYVLMLTSMFPFISLFIGLKEAPRASEKRK